MNLESILAYIKKVMLYAITKGTSPEDVYIGLLIAIFFGVVSFILFSIYSGHLLKKYQDKPWSAELKNSAILTWLNYLIAILAIEFLFGFYELRYTSQFLALTLRFFDILLLVMSLILITKGINFSLGIYSKRLSPKQFNIIKGYVFVVRIFVYIVGSVFIVCLILNESPWTILSSIGALTAVLMLVFKDTILACVANIRLSLEDLVRVGDWIEMPEAHADGVVTEISFHLVKVQNWDKSTVTIPIYNILSYSVKSWRSITEIGARRIKSKFLIDVKSVRFCDEELTNKLKSIEWLKDFFKETSSQHTTSIHILAEKPTNLGAFREYLAAYMRHHPKIRHDLSCTVNQSLPGKEGLPIEIYAFISDAEWINYEKVRASIVDHIFATVKEFDLRLA